MAETKPLFVKVDDYKDVHNVLALTKAKVMEAKEILVRIERLRQEETAETDLWKNEIADVEQRLEFIDRSMFGEQ